MIDQVQRQNLNKVYEHNVAGEALELAYGGEYAVGQTGAMQYWTKANHLTTSLYSDYSFSFDEHQFKVMAGVNTEKYNNRYLSVKRMDLITESVPEIGTATGEDKINEASAYTWATTGFFGRINYDYSNKYFIAGNLRYDGSSRFLRKDRWGLFGSFSLGWNMAAEDFFPVDENIINQLKPRVSWGTLGNQNTNSYYPMYLLQTVKTNGGSWLMGDSKPTVAGMPGTISSSLTWETVQSLNIGFDLGMFRNRLNVNFDYFIRKTLDMVGPASEVASIYGIGMPASNNTDLRTKGWEVAASWRDRIGQVNYNIGFNMADSRSFVDKYPNKSKSLSTYYKDQELGAIWGYVTHGIAKSQSEMDEWTKDNKPSWGSGWGEGDIMFEDLNGDKVINEGANTVDDPGDRKIIGNSTPRFRFGLDLGVEWKGIDFTAFFQGVGHRSIMFPNRGDTWTEQTVLNIWSDAYSPDNTDGKYPRVGGTGSKGANGQASSFWLMNGNYFRCKNIELGYTLPKQWVNSIGVDRCRVYVSGTNLFVFDHIGIYDPENSGDRGAYQYPLTKSFNFGINVSF